MPDSSLHTTKLNALLDRMQADDPAACEELLRKVGGRLKRLARKMLRQFPSVARWEQTEDILQNAVVRLLRALKEVRPPSVRAFFGLAATQMRRELIDLARHYQGPLGLGANHASRADVPAPKETPAPALDPPEPADHGWTQAQIAELFQVTERTVRRYWQLACLKLSAARNGTLRDT
jgi:DNA-directed RNA polymerase specialized sigma24 family protein